MMMRFSFDRVIATACFGSGPGCRYGWAGTGSRYQPRSRAKGEQADQNGPVGQRTAQISLDQPDEMNNASGSTEVNQPVKLLPTLSTQSADPSRGRGQSQRQHK